MSKQANPAVMEKLLLMAGLIAAAMNKMSWDFDQAPESAEKAALEKRLEACMDFMQDLGPSYGPPKSAEFVNLLERVRKEAEELLLQGEPA